MTVACLRLCFALATLVASLELAAETRFWTLSSVTFSDGVEATGYIAYDDATKLIVSWDVRVDAGAESSGDSWSYAIPFIYVPGSSELMSGIGANGVLIRLVAIPSSSWFRYLDIYLSATLDVAASNVAVREVSERVFYGVWDVVNHDGVGGSLSLSSRPTLGPVVQVDEFYHAGLRHYFITASASEKHALDTGVHPGWSRTGQSFNAYSGGTYGSGSTNPVCRYYSTPSKGFDSHFYSADAGECFLVAADYGPPWALETDDAFQIALPDKATGVCSLGTVPVYRYWHPGFKNHRYVTAAGPSRATMEFDGYFAEGYGPNGVAMCALQ